MTRKLLLKTLLLAACMETAALGSEDFSTVSVIAEKETSLRERSEFKKYFMGQKKSFEMPAFSLNLASKEAMMKSFFQTPSTEAADLVLAYAQKYHNEDTLDLSSILRDLNHLIQDNETSEAELLNILLRIQAAQSTEISDYEKNLLSHFAGLGEILEGLTTDDAWKSKRSMSSSIFEAFGKSSKFAAPLSAIYPSHYFSAKEVHNKAFETFEKELDTALRSMMSIVPVLDRGFVGFHFLIESLINEHFSISFPSASAKLSAHGIKGMSPLGFTLHDFAHIELYGKRAALKKYGGELFQQLVDQKVPYKKAIQIAIKRVVATAALLKETLTRALNIIDQKATSGEMSQADYAKAIYGYFYLLHENPLFFDPLFKCETFSDLLTKMGKRIPDLESFEETMILAKFLESNPFDTSHIDGRTALSDQDIISKIMRTPSRFDSFKVSKFDTFNQADDIDPENTKVHRSDFSIDVELHFENGNDVSFTFPTLRQNYTNVLHSLPSIEPFWEGAASIDQETADPSIAALNMAKITHQITQSVDYFLNQIDTPELSEFYTTAFKAIQEEFDSEVAAVKPAEIQMMPLHQEVAPSSSSYSYTPYVSEADTLRIQNELLLKLLAQKQTVSIKSNGPVEVNLTFGDGK